MFKISRSWRIYVGFAAALIIFASLWYTSFLVKRLEESERNKVEIFKYALQSLSSNMDDLDADVQTEFELLQSTSEGIPIIVVDDIGEIYTTVNFEKTLSNEEAKSVLAEIQAEGPPPIKNDDPNAGYARYIYYTRSQTLQLLSYFPIIQVMLIGVFIGISYWGLYNARREEENRIWVGMAKETAHQLGTPISAILAWIELLKGMDQDADIQDIYKELDKDVNRLELIADRFSKIGSKPELSEVNLKLSVDKMYDYMKVRSPKKVKYSYENDAEVYLVRLNPSIFEWVIENLTRNALDAMEGEGKITYRIYQSERKAVLEIQDTGKGIPAKQQKKIFKPGFSTKKRGWGLGLSLAKRIIEKYHDGKIYLKSSAENKGTVFTIELPLANE